MKVNENEKTADELIKKANELLDFAKKLKSGETEKEKERNVANKEGLYSNFTGDIEWRWTKGSVKNATFELKHYYQRAQVVFYEGIWENGDFADGEFRGGTWKKGNFNGGRFNGGFWKDGVWNDGWWDEGTWLGGRDKNGGYHGKDNYPDWSQLYWWCDEEPKKKAKKTKSEKK